MGCRKFKGRQYYDDMSEQTHLPEELEEMPFVFDGEALVLDLGEENAQAFRDAMAPFVRAARRTTKSKVLSTLPKRPRHLHAVPDAPPSPSSESEPREEAQNSPETHKGEAVEALSEPEGTRVPEAPSKPSDSSPPEETPKPVLSVVKDDQEEKRKPWLPMAPHSKDDQQAKVFKVRKWATSMGLPPQKPLTPEMFERWEAFYITQGWLNL